TAAVQGFGKVGRGVAKLAFDAGLTVIAISDEYGGLHNASGIDVGKLGDHVDATGSVVGFAGADPLDGDDLLELEVDLLVPAAIEGVIHEENASRVRAKVIVEGANGPTTSSADAI